MTKIFLDGPDGVGKSTLATYLSQRFKIDKFCLTKDSESSMCRYRELAIIQDVVHDRTFLSERIYPKVFKRNEWMSSSDVQELIDNWYFDGVFVICTAPTEIIKERILSRGKEYPEIIESIDIINRGYRELAERYDLLLVDTYKMNFDEIGDLIERRLQNGRH